ncbi:MAG TPA: radical SAM protein [bacterium]|nr:radical SAM protein [bacterium]
MKVLLVVPPVGEKQLSVQTDAVLSRCAGIILKSHYVLPPIGLMYLAAALKEWSPAEVEVLDCMVEGLREEESIKRIEAKAPQLLFFVLGTPSVKFIRGWLLRIRAAVPGVKTVAVGPHVTALSGESLEAVGMDFVVRGEPERTAADLAAALVRGGSLRDIPGLAWLENGKLVETAPRDLIQDMDSVPFPARELFANERYSAPFAKSSPFALILTSRGCPFQCIYCATRGYYGHSWRPRGVDNVLDELTLMVGKFGLKDIGFWDDTFTVDRRRVVDICRGIIDRRLGIRWICLSRVDTVDPETLGWMKKAGCYQIQFGVESGDERILKNLGKNITVAQVRNAFRWSKEAGIDPAAFFMFGNPGEDEESVRLTIKLALELPASFASFNINTPYPGSELFGRMREKLGDDWTALDARHSSYQEGFDGKSLEKYIREAYRKFYYRPRYLLRSLGRIRSTDDLKRYMKAGWDVLRRF